MVARASMNDHTRASEGESTASVHGGETRSRAHDAITTPIIQTSTYTFEDTAAVINFHEGRTQREEYGRYGNPTVRVAESKLVNLEGSYCCPDGTLETPTALLFASGMNAVTTALLALLSSGEHLILTDDCYRQTRRFVSTLLVQLNVKHTVVPANDYEAIEAAITPQTRLILSESPTNPYLRVLDFPRIVEIARRHGILTLIDATFATPYNVRPLSYGVDVVMHSATKYLGGHNDLLTGAIVGRADVIEQFRETQKMLGGVCDPNSAYLLVRGMKTLALRMVRHNENGMAVAKFLEQHPRVARVHYPGMPSHPDYTAASEQMRGFGGVVSFEVDGDIDVTSRVVDRMRLPYIAPSLGSVESMVVQPALMSFYGLSAEERLALGIRDNLIRLACGIEDADDIIADLAQALDDA